MKKIKRFSQYNFEAKVEHPWFPKMYAVINMLNDVAEVINAERIKRGR